MRDHDVTALTGPELEQARRELAASLALSRPGSPARVPILASMSAIDAELAHRSASRTQKVPGHARTAAERRALRHASPGDAGDAAHGAGQPPVIELQGPGQVGPCPGIDVVPFGGQGGQFPDGVDVAGPALR
jgi:hypothetical protein